MSSRVTRRGSARTIEVEFRTTREMHRLAAILAIDHAVAEAGFDLSRADETRFPDD